jgi:hypothetical protein
MRGFYLRAPLAVIARLDATVAYLAQALADLGDPTGLDERRVKAVLILANPTQAVHLLRAYTTWRKQQPAKANNSGTGTSLTLPTTPNPSHTRTRPIASRLSSTIPSSTDHNPPPLPIASRWCQKAT